MNWGQAEQTIDNSPQLSIRNIEQVLYTIYIDR